MFKLYFVNWQGWELLEERETLEEILKEEKEYNPFPNRLTSEEDYVILLPSGEEYEG